MVVGLGGVGSWAAEALVRSGIGKITLVDFDDICVTNMNRQLQALSSVVGQQKALVLAERFHQINPSIVIESLVKFYEAKTADEIFATRPDFVVDAIDNITAKCHLINYCHKNKIPLVCSTGSGGKLDPTLIQVKDLAETQIDPLAKALRRILREQYGFPLEGPYGISAVYSTEPAAEPKELHYDGGKGFQCICPNKASSPHGCENRSVILGTAAFVTASFGMVCASVAVRTLLASAPISYSRISR